MLSTVVLLASIASSATAYVVNNGTTCYVYPESLTHFGQPVDDTPSILHAFELCGTNGSVILENYTYHVNQVMNTTGLVNCDVELHGEMRWSDNIPYWLGHSYSVTYANLSTAWFFGGENVTFKGFGQGRFYGNGRPTSLKPQEGIETHSSPFDFLRPSVVRRESEQQQPTGSTDRVYDPQRQESVDGRRVLESGAVLALVRVALAERHHVEHLHELDEQQPVVHRQHGRHGHVELKGYFLLQLDGRRVRTHSPTPHFDRAH
jgi:hypothetical protein